jgi:fibronectin type 3 domain-containing protein/TolB-like protein
MAKRLIRTSCIFLLISIIVCPCTSFSAAAPQIRIAVFNFGTVNLEASGYNTMVTNLLINNLICDPSLALLDRKELEAFLSMNDLQQDDNVESVASIGSRLGLNMIVVGSVGKKDTVIVVNSKVIHIEQKRVIFENQIRALGDASLMSEIKNLGTSIIAAITNYASKQKDWEKTATQGPVNVQKRSGNKWVRLNWEDPPGMTASGYEVFRGTAESGPFGKIAQVERPEYLDQEVEKGASYYYKIRSFSAKGIKSDFSSIISAGTALTPNPPVILKADARVKSIELTWSPGPVASEDPLKLKGYKLYRSKVQQGPYKEVANLSGKEFGISEDSATAPDKLLKVIYLDKGLGDGEECYYQLTAYNEKNMESDFSSSVKDVTIPAVSAVSAQGDMIREIRLSWSPIDSPAINGYYVYRSSSESGDFAKIKKVDVSERAGAKIVDYADKDRLGDKTRYYYRVTAVDSHDTETSPSMTVSAVTKGKPPTPQGLTAQNGLVKKIELTWTASPYDEVEGYNLYWSKEKVGKYLLLKRVDGRTISSCTHGGGGFEKLADNGTYYYAMAAFNKVDVESDLTETVFATTKPRPSTPTGLKGEALKAKEVPLTWLPNVEKDIAVYQIYRGTGSEDGFSRIAKVQGKTRYEDKELKDGHKYRYKIRAEDKDELLSDFSEAISVETKPKPKKPEGLAGDIVDGKVQLTWQRGSEPDISYYSVCEKRFYGLDRINTVKANSFTEAGLAKGKSKTYVVTAVDKDDLESEPSQEVTITGR